MKGTESHFSKKLHSVDRKAVCQKGNFFHDSYLKKLFNGIFCNIEKSGSRAQMSPLRHRSTGVHQEQNDGHDVDDDE